MLLVLDWEITTSRRLVLGTDVVGDLFILCLFDRRLIILRALSKDFLLNEINS